MVSMQLIFVMLQNCPPLLSSLLPLFPLLCLSELSKSKTVLQSQKYGKTFFYWFIVQYGEVLLCVNIIFLKYKIKTSYRKGRFPTHRCSKWTLIACTCNIGRANETITFYYVSLQKPHCSHSSVNCAYKAFSFTCFVTMFSE